MLDKLYLYNFPAGSKPPLRSVHGHFLLNTCQRFLVVSFEENIELQKSTNIIESVSGAEAYTFLLHTICGLKSKLVGENEIVSQFKTAYQHFIQNEYKDTQLLLVLEKLFKDAKEIRSNYLLGLSQRTYASISRKKIVGKMKAQQVLIIGSGAMAEDLINQFKKKIKVALCARNQEKVSELAKFHSLEVVPWPKLDSTHEYPFIVNTIGCSKVVFKDEYFKTWQTKHKAKLFIDLGSPSAIESELKYKDGLMRLENIFDEGAIHEKHKLEQIDKAKIAMEGIANKRRAYLKKKLNKRLPAGNNNANYKYL